MSLQLLSSRAGNAVFDTQIQTGDWVQMAITFKYFSRQCRYSGVQNLNVYSDLSEIFLCGILFIFGVLKFFLFSPCPFTEVCTKHIARHKQTVEAEVNIFPSL